MEQSISNPVQMFLYDISGKILLNLEEDSSNITLIEIPTQNMQDGLYLVVIHAGNKEQIFKVVVVN